MKVKTRNLTLYTSSLLLITKLFVDDDISLDEYKSALSLLCENYRKEKNYG